jgi:hypothetical protein
VFVPILYRDLAFDAFDECRFESYRKAQEVAGRIQLRRTGLLRLRPEPLAGLGLSVSIPCAGVVTAVYWGADLYS